MHDSTEIKSTCNYSKQIVTEMQEHANMKLTNNNHLLLVVVMLNTNSLLVYYHLSHVPTCMHPKLPGPFLHSGLAQTNSVKCHSNPKNLIISSGQRIRLSCILG